MQWQRVKFFLHLSHEYHTLISQARIALDAHSYTGDNNNYHFSVIIQIVDKLIYTDNCIMKWPKQPQLKQTHLLSEISTNLSRITLAPIFYQDNQHPIPSVLLKQAAPSWAELPICACQGICSEAKIWKTAPISGRSLKSKLSGVAGA